MFTYLGAFSGSLDKEHNGLLAKPEVLNAKLRLLWVGAGTAEGGYKGIKEFHQSLEKAGIHDVFFENPGTAHEWATWRNDFLQFAPRLFRAAK
jgi:enterochelin esterase family protein